MTETNNQNHTIELYNRKVIKISGILSVESATQTEIVAKSEFGPLVICGLNLKIKKLAIEDKVIEAEGEVTKIEYTKAKKNLFQKVFK